jgi:hypothetical protein
MNDYITLDGHKYATLQRSWVPIYNPPMTARMCLDGTMDVTHGPAMWYQWSGEIKVEVTPATDYGGLSDLKDMIFAMTIVDFTDHRGDNYHVVVYGPTPEKSATPDWTAGSNELYVTVKIIGVYVPPT